jgi:hypothetical protein
MESKGFFGKIFELSFREFVTTSVVKVLYVLSIIGAVFYALAAIAAGFQQGVALGILALILSPIVFFIVVLVARVYMEVIIVLFRIAESVNEISIKLDSKTIGNSGPPAP